MKTYKLLTPGPLTTTHSVKKEMLFDHCTWDDNYKQTTQKLRRDLLTLAHVSAQEYTTVFMQGSGTFGVESVLSSIIPTHGKVLVLSNGAYGERIAKMCDYHSIDYTMIKQAYDKMFDIQVVEACILEDQAITHIVMVHSETTSGIVNDIKAIGRLCEVYNKSFIVDAMSSFGGIDIPMSAYHIDFLISSANKCIQGVPGFSFIIANRKQLIASKGCARSLSLDLYDQWETMEKDGKWRFTSPTHVVLAFAKAMEELTEEGGIDARNKRYTSNMSLLINEFSNMGFVPYIDMQYQGPIIVTFGYPKGHFSFQDMYAFIKTRGYAIYPGKLTNIETFRIGVIGDIHQEDIQKLVHIMHVYMEQIGG